MIRNIIEIGNPALREVAKKIPIESVKSEATQQLVDDLIETMRHANGAGLAATQIAVPLRVCVIEVNKNPRYPYKPDIPLTVLINPVITFLSEERLSVYEGCLSVPNVRGEVERCPEIRVRALNAEGVEIDMIVKGITAGTFQHELDHLDGVVFIDKVKDSKTLCTLKEFAKFHEDQFRNTVEQIVSKYGS
jgi:peptide deformylase